VEVQTATLFNPSFLYLVVFVGAEIVREDMQFSARIRPIQVLEEIQEIHMIRAVYAASLDRAFVSGQQTRGPVPFVSGRQAFGRAQAHGQ
jgi:hypothetical protein